jgi:hypothetical protein
MAIVWPGDCDNNGIVSASDVLPIGKYWRNTGPSRSGGTTQWLGQIVSNWPLDTLAAKADCDGNGIVSISDVLAIGQNWQKTHSKAVAEYAFNLDDPELTKYVKNYQEIYNSLSGESDAVREMKQVLLAVIQKYGAATVFYLSQSRPNPSHSGTSIEFGLPKESQASLKVYNINGQLVKTLIDEKLDAGRHTCQWDGKDQNGREAGSGIYFYRLSAGDYTSTKKMTVIR